MPVIGDATGTVVPFTVGAICAGIGSVLFIVRSDALADNGDGEQLKRRRIAIRMVLIIYAVLASLCLVAAVAIGDLVFVVTSAIITALAVGGLVLLLLRPDGW